MKRKPSTYAIQKHLLAAIREKWPTDSTDPGLVVSFLKSGEFYVSIVRYHGTYGSQKNVVQSTKSKTLAGAISKLARDFSGVKPAAMERLSSLLSKA